MEVSEVHILVVSEVHNSEVLLVHILEVLLAPNSDNLLFQHSEILISTKLEVLITTILEILWFHILEVLFTTNLEVLFTTQFGSPFLMYPLFGPINFGHQNFSHPIGYPKLQHPTRRPLARPNAHKLKRPIKLLNAIGPIEHPNFESSLGHPSGIRTAIYSGSHKPKTPQTPQETEKPQKPQKKGNCQII